MKDFLVLFRNLTALIVIIWILFNFVIGVTIAENDDMRPGIRAGDVLICYRLDKKPVLRELIIFKKNGHEYAGRVVAAGGDNVELDENSGLMVNDNVVSEEGILGRTYAFEGSVVYPLVLEKNEYFVLCDRRDDSEDSRLYGPVNTNEIVGTVISLYRKGSI